jgi:hypothetical protein
MAKITKNQLRSKELSMFRLGNNTAVDPSKYLVIVSWAIFGIEGFSNEDSCCRCDWISCRGDKAEDRLKRRTNKSCQRSKADTASLYRHTCRLWVRERWDLMRAHLRRR